MSLSADKTTKKGSCSNRITNKNQLDYNTKKAERKRRIGEKQKKHEIRNAIRRKRTAKRLEINELREDLAWMEWNI